MKILHKTFNYQTKNELDFVDISDDVSAFVKECGVNAGLVNIQSMHTTAAVIINENEPLLIDDMRENLKKIAPKDYKYKHNDFTIRTVNMCSGECANGHSHCQAIYLTPNVIMNLADGKIQFGQWQRIFLVELDHSRPRKVQVMVMGE